MGGGVVAGDAILPGACGAPESPLRVVQGYRRHSGGSPWCHSPNNRTPTFGGLHRTSEVLLKLFFAEY